MDNVKAVVSDTFVSYGMITQEHAIEVWVTKPLSPCKRNVETEVVVDKFLRYILLKNSVCIVRFELGLKIDPIKETFTSFLFGIKVVKNSDFFSNLLVCYQDRKFAKLCSKILKFLNLVLSAIDGGKLSSVKYLKLVPHLKIQLTTVQGLKQLIKIRKEGETVDNVKQTANLKEYGINSILPGTERSPGSSDQKSSSPAQSLHICSLSGPSHQSLPGPSHQASSSSQSTIDVFALSVKEEYDRLFREALDFQKNETFLGHVNNCFSSKNYHVFSYLAFCTTHRIYKYYEQRGNLTTRHHRIMAELKDLEVKISKLLSRYIAENRKQFKKWHSEEGHREPIKEVDGLIKKRKLAAKSRKNKKPRT